MPFGDIEASIILISILIFGPLVAVLLFSVAELLERSIKHSEQLDTLVELSVMGESKNSSFKSGDTVCVIKRCDDIDEIFMFDPGDMMIVAKTCQKYVLCSFADDDKMKHLVKMRYETIKKAE